MFYLMSITYQSLCSRSSCTIILKNLSKIVVEGDRNVAQQVNLLTTTWHSLTTTVGVLSATLLFQIAADVLGRSAENISNGWEVLLKSHSLALVWLFCGGHSYLRSEPGNKKLLSLSLSLFHSCAVSATLSFK